MRTKVNVAVVQGEVEEMEMEMGVIVLAEEVLVVIEEPLVMNPNARFVEHMSTLGYQMNTSKPAMLVNSLVVNFIIEDCMD